MAHSQQNKLPEKLRNALRGGETYLKESWAVPVLTVDEDGYPHVAMVSGVCLNGKGEIWFPLRRFTRTYRNVERTKRLTLMVVLPGIVTYLRAQVVEVFRPGVGDAYDVIRTLPVDLKDDSNPAVRLSGLAYEFLADDPSEIEERQVFHWLCQYADHPR